MQEIPFEYKFAIVVRKDLEMGCGKVAAQVGHAVAYMMAETWNPFQYETNSTIRAWFQEGQRKIVLKVQSEIDITRVGDKAAQAGLNVFYVRDAGRTQVAKGSLTCVGIGPAKEERLNAVLSDLKLF